MLALPLPGVRPTPGPPHPTGFATVRRRLLTALTLGLIAAAALLPAGAFASAIEVQRDCALDGRIDGTYSQKDYRDALRSLSSDDDEYTNCRDVIEAARLAAAGGNATAPGSAIPIPPPGVDPLATATPAQKSAVKQAQTTAPAAIVVGGKSVKPGELGAGRVVKASVSDLPEPLLVTIVLSVLAGIGALASIVIPRVRRYLDL